ncbi:MAG: MIP/aquaporin family protein [Cytophagales bacterium]|nr:MIP/aquaporin family protein [Cytophagales bacterium]
MNEQQHTTPQKAFAEFLGTLLLLCTVIGSGIMAERLAGGNVAMALLGNTLATVFILYVLIETLGGISGAHFNPLVSLVVLRHTSKPLLAYYVIAQSLGAMAGAWLAHAMFDLPIFQLSSHIRTGTGQWIAEGVATAGLIFFILRSSQTRASASALVASYIGAAYWFTASTSFANPAAVLGRMMTDSFSGIAPQSALGFVGAQIAGAALGVILNQLLIKNIQIGRD